jgi:hypothetical protein
MTCEAVLWGIMRRGPTGLFPGRNRWGLPKSHSQTFYSSTDPLANLPAVFQLD